MRQPAQFYRQSARTVAQALLGQHLVRQLDGQLVGGVIVETEAYCDHPTERDLACHGDRANHGQPTARSAVMFGPAGHAYVYLTYGMHWMFNVITGQTGQANGVLIRALEPLFGLELMMTRRKRELGQLTNGPAKLAQALAIDKSLNGANLCDPQAAIWVETGTAVTETAVAQGPRIGLGQVPEPWYSMPWRYWLKGNSFVSK